MLARDITSLDLVCGGRSVLCFAPPFGDSLEEAISVCRALWRAGEAVNEGPRFPVRAAANRSRPVGENGRIDRARPHGGGRPCPPRSPPRPTCCCGPPLTPAADVSWSACDGRHPCPRTAGHGRVVQPPSRAGTSRRSTDCAGWPVSVSWRTTSSSAGRRAVTSGSTSSSCCPVSSSPPCCSRSGWAVAASTSPPSGDAGHAGCCPPCSWSSRRSGALPDLQGALRGAGRQRPDRPVRVARRSDRHPAVRQQLAPHFRPPVVLRAVLDALAAAAHLVAGDRRAVLPRVAAPAPRAVAVRTPGLAPDRRHRHRCARCRVLGR